MDRERVRELLEAVAGGVLPPDQALARLRALPFEDLRFARVDLHRSLRHGVPEAVFCQGKTPEQVVAIVGRLAAAHDNVLATRAEPAVVA
ncbi:MAG: nickel pincer cofactor biosynthesis protein LarB, partial [Candidatus Rokuibacteriota bacterium]